MSDTEKALAMAAKTNRLMKEIPVPGPTRGMRRSVGSQKANLTPRPPKPEPKTAVASQSDTSDTSDTDVEEQLLARVRDGEWLDGQNFPPLSYAVPGLLPEGFTILIGPPKAGKSWLILDSLLGVAEGGQVLGRIPAQPSRRVLYLALEDGDRRMQDRCRKLLAGQPIPKLFHYLTTVMPGNAVATVNAFIDQYPDTALVVIDTLGKVMPPAAQGESAYQRDYRVGGTLKRITDAHPGLALVVLHHDRKAVSDDFVDAVSGTHGIAGAADTVIVLARKRQSSEGLLKVTGRDVPENEYALQLVDGCGWQLDGNSLAAAAARARQREDSASLSDISSDVIGFVRAAGAQGVRAGQVAEKFGRDAYQYLARQAEAGRLIKLARGLYAAPDAASHTPVSEPSEVSDSQVDGLFECDTESDTVRKD